MDRFEIKYRIIGNALPPRPIRVEVPGWGGSPDKKMENGSDPQPWHCPPFVDASMYGLELVYPYETECQVINDNGEIRFDWDYLKEPGSLLGGGEFGTFAPKPTKFYFFNSSVDVQAPPGYVVRTLPHPRFFTDATGTAPAALMGHVQSEWWAKPLFVVFKVPSPGQRHIFRKGDPYVQLILVPQRMDCEPVKMTPEEESLRRRRDDAIRVSKSFIAKGIWHNAAGSEFNDHYKVLARAFAREGEAGVDQTIEAAAERQRQSAPPGKTIPEYLDIGYQYQRQGKYIEAREVYFHILKLDSNNAEAVSRLGILAASIELPALALDLLSKAVQLDPRSPSYHANFGEALRREGRFAEAQAALRAALQMAPNDPRIMSNLGLVLAQEGRAEEGLQLCRSALAINPRLPVVHFRLGTILAQQGKFAEARAAYNAAIAVDPRFPDAWRGLQELPA